MCELLAALLLLSVTILRTTPRKASTRKPLPASAPHVLQQSSRRLGVVVCSLGARQRCRETQVSQLHVFMVRQTASQITATRMCTIYAQPNYACGPEDVPRERYIIPGAGDTLSGTRLCRTTGRSSSACTAYGRKCPVHVAPITYKLSDQDGTRVEPAIHENALL